MIAYTSSKHGVVGLVKHMAYFYGPSGIRSKAVLLGAVETGIGATAEPRSQWAMGAAPSCRWQPWAAPPNPIRSRPWSHGWPPTRLPTSMVRCSAPTKDGRPHETDYLRGNPGDRPASDQCLSGTSACLHRRRESTFGRVRLSPIALLGLFLKGEHRP
jgi:hypothetical protein